MTQDLSRPDRIDLLDGLQFANNEILDVHIDAQAFLESDAIVDDRQIDLSLVGKASLGQFMAQAHLVDLLEKPRAKGLVAVYAASKAILLERFRRK